MWLVNISETLWNEAVGESTTARKAVGWAIRNRAWIDMNGADHYPGSESDNNVWTSCRFLTPEGAQPGEMGIRYSCVVHGDTHTVGASHSQMNDGHMDVTALNLSGVAELMIVIINGYTSDPTSSPSFNAYGTWTTGNPDGAQEWLGGNYCALASSLKRRAGNVGGDHTDPGTFCPTPYPQMQSGTLNDNWFWARKP